jgi:hypothetical protein
MCRQMSGTGAMMVSGQTPVLPMRDGEHTPTRGFFSSVTRTSWYICFELLWFESQEKRLHIPAKIDRWVANCPIVRNFVRSQCLDRSSHSLHSSGSLRPHEYVQRVSWPLRRVLAWALSQAQLRRTFRSGRASRCSDESCLRWETNTDDKF